MADQDEKRTAPVMPERGLPFPGRIPWVLHERAWSQYAVAGHDDQSAERVAERGGFNVTELVACLRGYGYGAAGFAKVTAEDVALVAREAEGWDALLAERDAALQREAEARAEAARLRVALEVLVENYGPVQAASDKALCPRCEWTPPGAHAPDCDVGVALSAPGAETLRALRELASAATVALAALADLGACDEERGADCGFEDCPRAMPRLRTALAAVPWLRDDQGRS